MPQTDRLAGRHLRRQCDDGVWRSHAGDSTEAGPKCFANFAFHGCHRIVWVFGLSGAWFKDIMGEMSYWLSDVRIVA